MAEEKDSSVRLTVDSDRWRLDGSGADDIGIYFASDSTGKGSRWHLDRNGNEKWNGCENDQCGCSFDKCVTDFGQAGNLPVIDKW